MGIDGELSAGVEGAVQVGTYELPSQAFGNVMTTPSAIVAVTISQMERL